MSIKQNITSLQNLLEQVNNLPEAGTDLPELSNEGIADDLVTGKELINGEGNIVTGTNPYAKIATDTEVNTQADLIAQIVDALKEKSSNSIKLPSLSGNIILSPDIDLSDSDGFIEFINADGNNDGLYLFDYNPGDIITISVLKNSLLYVADRAYNREGIYCLNNGNSSEYIPGGIYRIEDDNFSFTITD